MDRQEHSDFSKNISLSYKNQSSFQNYIDLIACQNLILQKTDKIISQASLISFEDVINMFDLLDQMDDQHQKFTCETINLKLMSNYKENKIDLELQAQIISALLRKFNNHLTITSDDLFTMILAPQREKKIKGLILIKEITSHTQKIQYLASNGMCNLNSNQFSFARKQVSIKGHSEIIDCLLNRWEKKPQNISIKDNKREQKEKDYDINLLLTCCLVQFQNQMNEKQKKKVFTLIITQINQQVYIEEDKDLLYQFLSFLNCDKNFLHKREKAILRKLKILLDMNENQIIVPNSEQQQSDLNNTSNFSQISSIQISIIILKQILNKHLNQNSNFIPEIAELIFSLSENLNILLQTDENEEFLFLIENFNQSQKKVLLNDLVFNKMSTIIKEAGEGVQSQNGMNQIEYSNQQIRKIQGSYNLLYFYTDYNEEYFSQIARNFFYFIQFHLKNPQILVFVVKTLYRIAQFAFSSMVYLDKFYMNSLLSIFQDAAVLSNTENILIIQLFNQIYSRVNNKMYFHFYEYIPKLFEICMNQYSSSLFNSQSQAYQSLIQDLINTILSKEKVEYYIQNQVQISTNIFFSYISSNEEQVNQFLGQPNLERQQQQSKNFSDQINHIKCLCSLTNMYIQSENLKNDEQVQKVKNIFKSYTNQIYAGNFNHLSSYRLQLYKLFQSLQIQWLNDQSFVDEIFLKLYNILLADCQLLTNFKFKSKNQNEVEQQEEEDEISLGEESEDEEVYFIQPDQHLVDLKEQALQQLGQFIQVCPKIVMEHKKFEIIQILSLISTNIMENHSIVSTNFVLLGKMLTCVQQYFLKYLPDLYLDNKSSCQNRELSEESKLEYAPIFQILLNEFKDIDKQNQNSSFEYLVQCLYGIIKKLDKETRKTFFNQIYQAVKYHIKQTLHLLSPTLIQWQIYCLRQIYKAQPSQLQKNFKQIWLLISFKIFNQEDLSKHLQQLDDEQESQENQSQSIQDQGGEQSGQITEYSDDDQEEEDDDDEEIQQSNSNEEDQLDEEPEQSNNSEDDEEEEQKDGNNQNEQQNSSGYETISNSGESEKKNVDSFESNQTLNLVGLDISVVSETIGCVASLIKYDKYVYQIVSSKINKVILNKLFIEDSMIQRSCLYYLNIVTRFCFDSVQKDTFQQLFYVVKQLAESQKLQEESECGIVENIYITYCLMAAKLLENQQPKEYCEEDMIPFHQLLQIIPFQEDYPEMKRFIQICEFLLEFNEKFILQNLQKISLSITNMINEPLRYKILSQNEQQYQDFFYKLVKKFPQVKSIALNIIDLNLDNLFKEKDQLLKKLDLI